LHESVEHESVEPAAYLQHHGPLEIHRIAALELGLEQTAAVYHIYYNQLGRWDCIFAWRQVKGWMCSQEKHEICLAGVARQYHRWVMSKALQEQHPLTPTLQKSPGTIPKKDPEWPASGKAK
jgi:hypothetical protein